ncbi:MAG: hypothetical protein NTZ84_00580 [Candidatus Nealsonbacteria bacterium]|nr:hypothetical protein [Candidatus Nealsonbacteria bacterium]
MAKENKEKLIYISLREASKNCNYSQEYLSLRARQGKLKSAKFGRNWITTKEWLEEYAEKSKEYNSAHNGNSYRTKNTKEGKITVRNLIPSATRITKVKKITIIKVPKNLPVEKAPTLRLGLATALVFVLFLAAGFIGQQVFFNNAFENIYSLAQEIFLSLGGSRANINSENFTADLQGKFKEYIKVLADGIELQFVDFKTRLLLE